MKGRKKLLLLTALLPLSMLAKANNETGNKERGKTDPVLLGMVADASTRKPLQGVTVSIASIAKGQDREKKEFVTDALGNFKVPQMPPGEVVIILEKKGYKTFRRENVVIKEGVSLKLNFDITTQEEDESDVFHPLMRMMDGD